MSGKNTPNRTRIYTQYDTDYPRHSDIHIDPSVPGESMTQQHMAADCDINNIMQQHNQQGIDLLQTQKSAIFADVADIPSLQASIELIEAVRISFMKLPIETRRKFGENPLEMMAWLKDPKNNEEAQALGLRQKPEVKMPQETSLDQKSIEAIGETIAKKQQKKAAE